jgi:hypothetical protein
MTRSNSTGSKKKKPTKLSEATKVLAKSLKKDKGLKISYVSNISMFCFDSVVAEQRRLKRKLSKRELLEFLNKGAENFIDAFCS